MTTGTSTTLSMYCSQTQRRLSLHNPGTESNRTTRNNCWYLSLFKTRKTHSVDELKLRHHPDVDNWICTRLQNLSLHDHREDVHCAWNKKHAISYTVHTNHAAPRPPPPPPDVTASTFPQTCPYGTPARDACKTRPSHHGRCHHSRAPRLTRSSKSPDEHHRTDTRTLAKSMILPSRRWRLATRPRQM